MISRNEKYKTWLRKMWWSNGRIWPFTVTQPTNFDKTRNCSTASVQLFSLSFRRLLATPQMKKSQEVKQLRKLNIKPASQNKKIVYLWLPKNSTWRKHCRNCPESYIFWTTKKFQTGWELFLPFARKQMFYRNKVEAFKVFTCPRPIF